MPLQDSICLFHIFDIMILFSPAPSAPMCWGPGKQQKWTLVSKENRVFVEGKTETSSH